MKQFILNIPKYLNWLWGFIVIFLAIVVFCVGLTFITIISFSKPSKPKAIDVYRGNTDLVINYKTVNGDTISIDSTVVYKSKNYEN